MKTLLINALALAICCAGLASEAMAQGAVQEATGALAPAAPAAAPVDPTVQASAPPGYFPSLPPARPCTTAEVTGTWKLKQVYENPIGKGLSDFSAMPYQYIMFGQDSAFNSYRNVQKTDSDNAIQEKLKYVPEGSPLQQFVVNETGILYFYENGLAIDTQACFIVANTKAPFNVGEMLLMPPASENVTTRLVKVYESISNPPRGATARQPGVQQPGQRRGRMGQGPRGKGRVQQNQGTKKGPLPGNRPVRGKPHGNQPPRANQQGQQQPGGRQQQQGRVQQQQGKQQPATPPANPAPGSGQ